MNENYTMLKTLCSTLITSAIFGAIGTGLFIMLEPHISQAPTHPGPAVLLGNWNLFLALTAFLWLSMLVVLMIGERPSHTTQSTQKANRNDSKGKCS